MAAVKYPSMSTSGMLYAAYGGVVNEVLLLVLRIVAAVLISITDEALVNGVVGGGLGAVNTL